MSLKPQWLCYLLLAAAAALAGCSGGGQPALNQAGLNQAYVDAETLLRRAADDTDPAARAYAIEAMGGSVLVRGCEFKEDKNQVYLGEKVDRAIITDNLFQGVKRVRVHGLLDGRDTPPRSAIEFSLYAFWKSRKVPSSLT